MKEEIKDCILINDQKEFIQRDCRRIFLRLNDVQDSPRMHQIEIKLLLYASFEGFKKNYKQACSDLKEKKNRLEADHKTKFLCVEVLPVFVDSYLGSYVKLVAILEEVSKPIRKPKVI